MKKLILLTSAFLSLQCLHAQQVPTNNSPTNGGENSKLYWSRSGNTNSGNGVNNIFGTKWNSPIYFITGGLSQATYRMRLNGTFISPTQYSINGYTYAASGTNGINTSGYLALGYNMGGFISHNTGSYRGPFSLLHLNGRDGTFVQDGGFRPWMKTGITFTDNNDLSYIGMRKISNDVTETVITWADNSGNGFPGPDDMVFRFTSQGNGNTNISNNLTSPNDFDGLHVARFTGEGLFGLGNTFGTGNPLYVRPQSLQHLSLSNYRSVWTQYTNRNVSVGSGTGETASDGLRIGILGSNINQRNGNALIYQQERRHLLFSTNANTTNINPMNTKERMRITSINAPTELPGNNYGVYNPGNLPGNLTRVSISHNPNNPVTRPLSLLHIGYNTGAFSLTGNSTDGWRDWMDIGIFGTNGTDNFYFGLKAEGDSAIFPPDRVDAVISWGDNQPINSPLNNGPDHLRFIFTSTTTAITGQGDPVSKSNNGLEVARFYPDRDTLGNYGRFGVGDFTVQGVNEEPTHKLDVVGNGRFRLLPDSIYMADSSVNKIVMVDSLGVLRWADASFLGFGNACGDSVKKSLTVDWEIPLNGFSYNFTADSVKKRSRVNVGDIACGTFQPTRLYSKITEVMDSTVKEHAAIIGHANGTNFLFNTSQYGVWGKVVDANSFESAGVFGQSINPQAVFSTFTRGIGVKGTSTAAKLNMGVYGYTDDINATYNIGGVFTAANATNNYGVFCSAPIVPPTNPPAPPTNLALYASGDVFVSGTAYLANPAVVSDQQFKTNIDTINNANDIIAQLIPRKYNYNSNFSSRMHFPQGMQYGFIAQEVENVLPDIISLGLLPEERDSSGNILNPSVTYKTLNYNAFIAILTKAVQEQKELIDSLNEELAVQDSLIDNQDSINNALLDKINQLEQCVNQLGLCNYNNAKVENNINNNTQFIELSNANSIILDQNVPNPFAENTTINYNIPEDVQNAMLIFYDINGRILKEVQLLERGQGNIVVYGENLKSGIYTYTLIADDKVIDTKKMVKAE